MPRLSPFVGRGVRGVRVDSTPMHDKHFAAERIVPDISATELPDVLAELVSVFTASGAVGQELGARILEAAQAKLANGVTGAVGSGVAIPHVKVEGVEQTLAVLARSSEGLEFQAGDGLAVHVVFFVIGPPNAAEEHLDLLRWIAGLARNPDFTRFALSCTTPSELFELVQELAAT